MAFKFQHSLILNSNKKVQYAITMVEAFFAFLILCPIHHGVMQ